MMRGAAPETDLSPWEALRRLAVRSRDRKRSAAADASAAAPGAATVLPAAPGAATVIPGAREAALERAAIDRRLFDSFGLPRSFTSAVVVPSRGPRAAGPGIGDPDVRHRRLGLREAQAWLAEGRRPGDLVVGTPAVCEALRAAADRAGLDIAFASSWDLSRPTRALLAIDHDGPPEAPAELYVAAELTAPIAVRHPDCPAMHVNADAVHVEVLHPRTRRPVPPGTAGLLVLTDLLNTAAPLVRYVVGDVGALVDPEGTCDCGRVTPRLLLLGRVAAPDGVTARLTVDVGPRGIVRHVRRLPAALSDLVPDGGLWLSAAERHPLTAGADRTAAETGDPRVRAPRPRTAPSARSAAPRERA